MQCFLYCSVTEFHPYIISAVGIDAGNQTGTLCRIGCAVKYRLKGLAVGNFLRIYSNRGICLPDNDSTGCNVGVVVFVGCKANSRINAGICGILQRNHRIRNAGNQIRQCVDGSLSAVKYLLNILINDTVGDLVKDLIHHISEFTQLKLGNPQNVDDKFLYRHIAILIQKLIQKLVDIIKARFYFRKAKELAYCDAAGVQTYKVAAVSLKTGDEPDDTGFLRAAAKDSIQRLFIGDGLGIYLNRRISLGNLNRAGSFCRLVVSVAGKFNRQLLLTCIVIVFEGKLIVVKLGVLDSLASLFIQHGNILITHLLNKSIHGAMIGLIFYRIIIADFHGHRSTGVYQIYRKLSAHTGVLIIAFKADPNHLGVLAKGMHIKLV